MHLADFPVGDGSITDADLERRMGLARAIVANTLALRNEAGINVRQPVARILVVEEPGAKLTVVYAHGNAVDIDHEMTRLAMNQQAFQASTVALNKRLSMIRLAIMEGRG